MISCPPEIDGRGIVDWVLASYKGEMKGLALGSKVETIQAWPSVDAYRRLFVSLRNQRRLALLEELGRSSGLGLEELQGRLRSRGYYHSRSTLGKYLRPLCEAGLVTKTDKFKITPRGARVNDVEELGELEGFLRFSKHNEELFLMALMDGPKSHWELTKMVVITHPSTVWRVSRRLERQGLLIVAHPKDRVSYFRTDKEVKGNLSPTERRLLVAIEKGQGTIRGLSEEVGINIRRTYKYLRRLRQKMLISTSKRATIFELTNTGKQVCEKLLQIANLLSL